MTNGGGSGGKQQRQVTERSRAAELVQAARAPYAHVRAYDHARMYAHVRAYLSLALKGSGLVALLLSTVILLGGYVQSLVMEDFFCIMTITVIQAAGIFHDWETNLQYLMDFKNIVTSLLRFINAHMSSVHFRVLFVSLWPFLGLSFCIQPFYMLGPLVSAAISSWRIAKLNRGNNRDGTDSTVDMTAALNIFYSLIIFQGTTFLLLLMTMSIYFEIVARYVGSLEQLSEKWCQKAIRSYIRDISNKCRKDPLSIKGMDLIKYGAELLDSESQEDYLYGARLLSAFVNKGEDVSWVLLPSRHRIQRLIDSLVISSSSRRLDDTCVHIKLPFVPVSCYAVIGGLEDKKEIRDLAATIMADVAAHIDDLSNYPGAMQSISSLLEHQEKTTQQTYRNQNSKQVPDNLPPLQGPIGPLTKQEYNSQERRIKFVIEVEVRRRVHMMRDQKRMEVREHRHRNKRGGGTSNQLVQQGLKILERLASNSDDNRRLICSAPGLLPKITAPIYSATFIEDVKIKSWADTVTRCLKVLYQLICAPDGSHEIFSNNVQALTNLKSILELGNTEAGHQELQLVAMEILTELPLDLSINLNKHIQQVLIIQQLQLFLANGDGAAMAGRTLVSMSSKSERICSHTMTTQNSIIDGLTGILDDENITRRTVAAEIMANLYAHYNVNNTTQEILPKVLRKIMSIKTKSQERKVSAGQNNPAASGDEENQENSVSTNNEENQSISTDSNNIETEEISDQEREEQEAFLSLAQVICDRLDSADLDGAIQSAVDQNNAASVEQRREAFVDKLKTIIDDNCHAIPDCLRIVKLCGRIAKSVLRCDHYVEIFRNRGFKSSLSEASKTMSELESCMLFVGSDFGPMKTVSVRPLLSKIEESFGQI